MSLPPSPFVPSSVSAGRSGENVRSDDSQLAMAALASAARMGDIKTTKHLVRLGVAREFMPDLDHKEKKNLADSIEMKINNIEQLINCGLVYNPSARLVERNPFERGLFKITFIPGTDVRMHLMINPSAVRSWDSTTNIEGCQPLHLFCSLPDVPIEAVKYLLQCHPIDINQKTTSEYTALLIAVLRGNYPLVKLLIEFGASVNESSIISVSMEELGSYYPYLKAFSPVVEALPPLRYYFTPLEAAIFANQEDIMRYLVKKGANIHMNDGLWNSLFHPIVTGRRRIVERLIACGVDVNGRDMLGTTPLHKSAGEGLIDLTHVLLRHGADANAPDNLGWTPLHVASLFSQNVCIEMIQLLLDGGADVEVKTRFGFTPLNLAEAGTDLFFLESLATNINSLRSNSKKFIMPEEDSKKEHEDIITLLLDNGADVNHQDDFLGWTTLHWAAAIGDLRVAKLLVSRGALVSIRSKFHYNAYQTALFFNRPIMSAYLKTVTDEASCS